MTVTKLKQQAVHEKPPQWFTNILDAGFQPYIATSKRLLPFLNTEPFGHKATCFLMEEEEHTPMLEAYLLSNSLSFDAPGLKMPHWVLVDCALMQTAVVGYMKPVGDIPDSLIQYYRNDPSIKFDKLTHVPLTGQIGCPAMGGDSLSGISLFSLGRKVNGPQRLGLYTKALAMEAYKAHQYQWFFGVTQYDNHSLRIHGRFSKEMEIYQPIVPLHPGKDMTFIYKMAVDFDPYHLAAALEEPKPTFWLNAYDVKKKIEMQEGLRNGKRYIIVPPFSVKRDNSVFLPIIEKDKEA